MNVTLIPRGAAGVSPTAARLSACLGRAAEPQTQRWALTRPSFSPGQEKLLAPSPEPRQARLPARVAQGPLSQPQERELFQAGAPALAPEAPRGPIPGTPTSRCSLGQSPRPCRPRGPGAAQAAGRGRRDGTKGTVAPGVGRALKTWEQRLAVLTRNFNRPWFKGKSFKGKKKKSKREE